MPAGGHANGDPASDYLYARPLFYSFETQMSPQALDAVVTTLERSRRAGYPIRAALIERRRDLGLVRSLWGHPSMYVRFLDQEIRFRYRGPVLVVMPAGIGFTRADADPQAERRALSTVHVATGRDGLAATAILAVARLAARSGHPIVPAAIRRQHSAGHRTVWLVVAGGLAALVAAGSAAVVVRRRPL